MLSDRQRQALLSSVSVSRLLALAAELDGLERWPGSPGLDRCCERLAESLRQAGAESGEGSAARGGGTPAGRGAPMVPVELERFPIGPERRYLGWSVERRPVVERAELWLLRDDGSEVPICRGAEEPACVMGAYRSTSEEGEVLEVVDVGLGTRSSDYRAGHRLGGRLALASGHHFSAVMLEALVQRRAEGLLCGPGPEPDPGRVVPNRLAEPSLFGEHRPFGFNLSRHQHDLLVSHLGGDEPLRVRVRLQQRLDTGHLPVCGAQLAGSDLAAERVLLLCELPSTGRSLAAACLREALHALRAGIVAGQLQPLRRTLQLLVSPGPAATVAWLAEHRALLPRVRAAVLLGLPAADAAGQLRLHAPPPSRPSFVPDLLLDHLRWAGAPLAPFRAERGLRVEPGPYAPGSPVHPLVDGELGLAAVWLQGVGSAGGDPRAAAPLGALHLLCSALAGAALDLCSLDEEDLPRLVSGSHCKALGRLAQRAEDLRASVQRELREAEGSSTAGRHLLWLAEMSLREGLRREQAVVRSCGDYLGGPGQQALRLAEAGSDLQQICDASLRALHAEIASTLSPRARLSLKRRPLSAPERRAQAIRVVRTCAGPLPLPYLLREATPADREWLAHKSWLLDEQPLGEALLQWADGESSVLDIHDRLCLDYPDADLRLTWRYLEVLQGAGFVRLEEAPRTAAPQTTIREGDP
jgi:hypothetical protein